MWLRWSLVTRVELPHSFLNKPPHDKTNKMTCASSEDSDQPGHPLKEPWVFGYPLSTQRRLRSDWADAQAVLSLRWVHLSFSWFCRAMAHKCFVIEVDTPDCLSQGCWSEFHWRHDSIWTPHHNPFPSAWCDWNVVEKDAKMGKLLKLLSVSLVCLEHRCAFPFTLQSQIVMVHVCDFLFSMTGRGNTNQNVFSFIIESAVAAGKYQYLPDRIPAGAGDSLEQKWFILHFSLICGVIFHA